MDRSNSEHVEPEVRANVHPVARHGQAAFLRAENDARLWWCLLEVPISVSSGQLHAGDLTQGMSFEFALALPPEALPSYASEHGELYWRIDVKSDELGNDTHEIRRIDVEPRS